MSYPPPKTKLIECPSRKSPYIKWGHFVDGGNGYLYGIPFYARRVLEMNIEDKSIKSIGPLLTEVRYLNGIRANNGSIYCVPFGCDDDYFLKITPKEGGDAEVKILTDRPLPDSGFKWWREGVLAKDGCIYYLPLRADHVLKLDPSCGDSLSLVGDEFYFNHFEGAVLGKDNCVYGISEHAIIKINLVNNRVLHLKWGGFSGDSDSCNCNGYGGVLAADGNIYTSSFWGQIIKIDTAKNCYTLIGNALTDDGPCFGLPVLGADNCIYFPPCKHDQVLQFNPITQSISFVGDSYRILAWYGGALASDGFIYYASHCHRRILQVDTRPLNEIILELVQKSIG